jgi:hypothetical protein
MIEARMIKMWGKFTSQTALIYLKVNKGNPLYPAYSSGLVGSIKQRIMLK